jgi:hypothetical protein
LYGSDLVARQGNWFSRFAWLPVAGSARAWRLPLTGEPAMAMLETAADEPAAVLGCFDGAEPLSWRSPFPGRVEIDVDGQGQEVVVVAQLADPQWRALWIGGRGAQATPITAVFRRPGQGGWQALRVPERGRWTLRLDYDPRDVRQGLAVSGISWLLLVATWIVMKRPTTPIPREDEPA